MYVRNHVVVEEWTKGNPARNHRGSFWTNGKELYSYNLHIGDTDLEKNVKVLKDYRAKGTYGFRSQTTSCHIGLAARSVDVWVI